MFYRCSLIASLAAACALVSGAALQYPQVDLGYEVHRALTYDQTNGLYRFANIRYAAPPTGNNRFRAPQPPAKNRATVQIGQEDRICPQAVPAWNDISNEFVPIYLKGEKFNKTIADLQQLNRTVPAVSKKPGETEDCLFLDVVVPKPIFDQAGKNAGAPVLVWIHGGGYTLGQKAGTDPTGLVQRSRLQNSEGIVYVSLNYRLGAFGWSSGPTFVKDGLPNAALYDQLAALKWVQAHISKFGGDPKRVTIMGESAGGGSVMHQITAYGGKRPVPFQQAIPQSPAWQEVTSRDAMERTFNGLLKEAKVKTLSDLRKLSEDALIAANHAQIWHATYGSFVYGPTVDSTFVPQLPGILLAKGQFAKNVRVMNSHTADEGLVFASPFTKNTADLAAFFRPLMPSASDAVIKYITQMLYPPAPQSKGTLSYTTETGRAALAIAEFAFICNTNYLNKAYGGSAHAYRFNVPPGTHGQDVAYTFYSGGDIDNSTVAFAIQDYITSFTKTGTPKTVPSTRIAPFPVSDKRNLLQDLGVKGIGPMPDDTANARCAWWQKAYYQ